MRSRQNSLIIVFCLIQIFAVFVGLSPAEVFSPIEIREHQVTGNPADQYGPAVSGERVTFTDNRNGNADIFLVNLETGVEIQVTASANDEILGGFDGTSVVFTTSTIPSQSFVYDRPSAATIPLATITGSSNQSSPAVGGHIAAWIDDRDVNKELYTRNLISGVESRGTNTPTDTESKPAVSLQGRVTFESCAGGSCDIRWLDPSTGIVSPVTSTPEDEQSPDIDGDHVVFDSNRDGDHDIYLFNIISGLETRIRIPGIQKNAKISGDFVSFEDIDSSSGATHIGLYRISTGSTYQVTPSNASHTSNQFLNDISTTADREGRIVYADDRNGNLDIFVTKFEVPDNVDVCNGIDDNHDGRADEGFPAGNTPCGADVEVVETNPDDITDITAITFPSVDMSGDTVVTTAGTGPAVPAGFGLGNRPVYHEITTSVGFSGSAQVCIGYDPAQFTTERSLRLLHWNGSKWDNITTNVNTATHTICGVTTSFSPFIVAQQASTAVTLSNLSVTADGSNVLLTWSTRSETDNEGFVVLRSESPNGPFSPVSSMIPAAGGLGMKATYSITDSNVAQGKTYYYRLQDIDTRGVVTTHNVIPVTTVAAGWEKPSQKIQGQKQDIQGELPPTLVLPRKGGGDGEGDPVVPTSAWIRDAEVEIASADSVSLAMTSQTKGARDDSSSHPHPASPVKGEEYSESSLQAQGPSSFSVSIEDDKGNIIMVSRVADTESNSTSSGDLMVTDESGRLVLTWQGKGKVKGYILQRAEKGKDNYTAISNLIPYFGRDDKELYLYKFFDNAVKPGIQYEYLLEVVKQIKEDDLKLGKLAE